MNNDEKIAHEYLDLLGNIEFEPDGNVPPDFLLNKKTAIEVRRLNQNFRQGNKVLGLENATIDLFRVIEEELEKHPYIKGENRYWIELNWKRGIGKYQKIKSSLRKAIEDFENLGEPCPKQYKLSNNVEFKIISLASNTKQKYSAGIFSDRNSGGWVVDIYLTEINHCIKEKSLKVQPYADLYPEWWLVLVDRLYGLDSDTKQKLTPLIKKNPVFSKIIIIDSKGKVQIEI